jgi:hypothetical protein
MSLLNEKPIGAILDITDIEPIHPSADDLPKERPLPPFAATKEDQATQGAELQDWISQSLAAKGAMTQIWARIAAFNRDDPAGFESAPDEGFSPIHRPFISTRTDTLSAQIVNILTTPSPVALCESYSGDEELSSRLERAVERQAEFGGFDEATNGVVQNAILYNKGIYRLSFEIQFDGILPEASDQIEPMNEHGVRFAGLKWGSVDPIDFIISPSTADGVQSAQMCGERFYRRVEWCKEQESIGAFLPGSAGGLSSGDNPADNDIMRSYVATQTSPSASTGTPETSLVELWELYFKKPPSEGKREKWYKAIVAKNTSTLMDIQEWPYTRPPYFVCGVLTDTIKFWGSRSLGREAIPMQDQFNKYHGLLYNGNYQAAENTIVGPEPMEEKYTVIGMNRYLKTDGQVQFVNTPFRAEGIQSAITDLERAGDLAFGVTSNAQGVPESKVSITATQTQAQTQGATIRLTHFLHNFQLQMPLMFAFACEILADQFILWAPFDPETEKEASLGDDPIGLTKSDFKQAKRWTVNGKTPTSTPMARLAELQQLMVMARDPETGLDKYAIIEAYLETAAIPGSRNFQKQRPIGQPAPVQQGIPGEPAVAGPEGPSIPPQITDQGEHLPPNEAASVRPSGSLDPQAPR